MSTYEEIQNNVLGGWRGDDLALIDEHLDFIADIDLSEPDYSFHLLRIYVRRSDGMLMWATDAGCSCPSPFEDIPVKDLRESTLSTFTDAFLKHADAEEYCGNSLSAIRMDITTALIEAKSRGAR